MQQQAAGQAAELQAQQQLAAQQQLGAQANQQVAQQGNALANAATSSQNISGQGLQSAAQANNAALGNASQVNQFNSPLASQNQSIVGQGLQNVGVGLLNQVDGMFDSKPSQPVSAPSQAANPYSLGVSLPQMQVPKLSHGGEVPGEALVAGDHEDNDVVPTLLSPGEIVVPRSYASDPKAAAAFAHACALFANKGK
jgi:hypothetical protein